MADGQLLQPDVDPTTLGTHAGETISSVHTRRRTKLLVAGVSNSQELQMTPTSGPGDGVRACVPAPARAALKGIALIEKATR